MYDRLCQKWSMSLALAAVVWIVWASWIMWSGNLHHVANNWPLSLTMCFGSFIAGATSEGGGAVAFPVMTLLFQIPPSVARDFSLMIQSVGMTAAAVLIFTRRIRIEYRALLLAGCGGAVGIVVGIELLSPRLPPTHTKVFFTSLWMSFGGVLFWINRNRNRFVLDRITGNLGASYALIATFGFLGGVISGILGSGIDILTFSLLVMVFRIDEKIATPTSVVLMAFNAITGFLWRGAIRDQLAPDAWIYWYACVPVVVVGAPLGAYFIREKTRHFISCLLYSVILIQFAGSLIVVPLRLSEIAAILTTLCGGASVFIGMAFLGSWWTGLGLDRSDSLKTYEPPLKRPME